MFTSFCIDRSEPDSSIHTDDKAFKYADGIMDYCQKKETEPQPPIDTDGVAVVYALKKIFADQTYSPGARHEIREKLHKFFCEHEGVSRRMRFIPDPLPDEIAVATAMAKKNGLTTTPKRLFSLFRR
jgi:hypothetical protein